MTSSNRTFSELLDLCAGNSSVTGEFPSQGPLTRSFDVFFYLCLNERFSKPSWGWWLETSRGSLCRHCNEREYKHVCEKWKYTLFESMKRLILRWKHYLLYLLNEHKLLAIKTNFQPSCSSWCTKELLKENGCGQDVIDYEGLEQLRVISLNVWVASFWRQLI